MSGDNFHGEQHFRNSLRNRSRREWTREIIELSLDEEEREHRQQSDVIGLTGEDQDEERQPALRINLTVSSVRVIPPSSPRPRGRERVRRQRHREASRRSRVRSRSPVRYRVSPVAPVEETHTLPRRPQDNMLLSGVNWDSLLSNIPSRIIERQTTEEEETPETCSICLDDYELGQPVITLPCNHDFHSQCVKRWLQENPSCPLCRQKLFQDNETERVVLVTRRRGRPDIITSRTYEIDQ